MLIFACVRDEAEAAAAVAAGFGGTVGAGGAAAPAARWEDEGRGETLRVVEAGRNLRFAVLAGAAPPAGTLGRWAAAGWDGVLLRHGGRLLDALTIPALAEWTAEAHAAGLRLACSGGLEAADVSRLRGCGVDLALFGRALRRGESLDAASLQAIGAMAAQALEPGAGVVASGRADRIFVRDLVCAMEVGAYRSEQGRRQRVRFAVEAELLPRPSGPPTLAAIVSYDLITDAVARLTAGGHVDLVETLAEDVAAAVLAEPRVAVVRVRVEKLDLGPGAVGVEIERRRGGEDMGRGAGGLRAAPRGPTTP